MTDNILQEWTLTSENGGNIQLTFRSFDLEGCSYYYYDYSTYEYEYLDECTCIYDYVEVFYGSYNEKFCGDTVPEVITSCGSSITIKFHSDGYVTRTGFRAEWEELSTSTPCSATTTTTPPPCVPPTCDAANCLMSHADHSCSNYPNNADQVN